MSESQFPCHNQCPETPILNITNQQTNQTAFNAYPLESSTTLLNAHSDVIYMPLSPTDIPLSIHSPTNEKESIPQVTTQTYGQPICHGLIFPHSGQNINDPGLNVGNSPELVNLMEKITSNPDTRSQLLNELEQNAERHLQLLLLQRLIALQLSQQYVPIKNIVQPLELSNMQPLSDHLSEPNLSNLPTSNLDCLLKNGSLNTEQTDRSTFLVPVDAKFNEDSSLALYITPRDESSSATHESPMKMQCPDQQLVLYPFVVPCKTPMENPISIEDSVPSVISETAQALTMKDIHQCIRRGSLEAVSDPNYDIVQSIRGSAKPGFVLLSVKREKINTDMKITSLSGDQLVYEATTANVLNNAPSESKKGNSPESLKKSIKKRSRSGKIESEQKRRSIRRSSKVLKVLEASSVHKSSNEISEEESTNLNAKSRFRVTRFADKKQAWMAPSEAGCFAVHDLWTTKLPDYVLKCAEKIRDTNLCNSPQLYLSDKTKLFINKVSRGCCAVCENHPPKPCQCSIDFQQNNASTSTSYHETVPLISSTTEKNQ